MVKADNKTFHSDIISDSIFKAHQRLSVTSSRFLHYIQNHPEALTRSHFDVLTSFQGDYLNTQPWPTFINSSMEDECRRAAVSVFNLIKSIPGRIFSYDAARISQYYNIPLRQTQSLLFAVDDDFIQRLLGRGDFVFSPVSGLKCIEYNVQANLGGWEIDIMEDLYINVPVISSFLKEHGIGLKKNRFFEKFTAHLAAQAVNHFGRQPSGELNAAICFPSPVDYTGSPIAATLKQIYQHNLSRYDSKLKGDLIVSNASHFRTANGKLTCNGQEIHSIVEMDRGSVPAYVMEIVNQGDLLLYNGPVTRIMSNKLNIALLWENMDSGLFSKEEQDIIKTYIPWTRKITHDTAGYILKNKDDLVLKPPEELGGKDVQVGRFCSQSEWEETLHKAVSAKNWVAQEWLDSYQYLYQAGEYGCVPHRSVWGFFVFANTYAGGFVRLLPDSTGSSEKKGSGVINSHVGAEESMILVVPE